MNEARAWAWASALKALRSSSRTQAWWWNPTYWTWVMEKRVNFWACWSSLRIKIKLIRSQQWAWKHCAPNLSKREDGCLYLKHNEKYEWFERDSNPTSVAFFLGYNIDGFCLICAQLVNGLSCVKRFLFVVWVWTWVGDSNTPSQLEYELQYQIFHKVYIIAYINI